MSANTELIPIDQIEPLIRTVRSQNVLLDSDLALMYGIPTKVLNQAVKRNRGRFPDDFMFQLSQEEIDFLRSQNVTLKGGRGQHRKYPPNAFTEHGAIMAATILNSPRAVQVSVFVVRAFVKMRQLVLTHRDLAARMEELERKVGGHDDSIRQLVAAIRQLMAPPKPKGGKIGFGRESET